MLAFSLLGPVRATADGRELALGGVKQRSLLALLLLEAPRTVPADRLVDALWGEAPPADAATALQAHVSRLRKALAPHAVIVTRPPGYAAELAGAELDVRRFEALAADGRQAEALSLWSGDALADVRAEPWVAPYAERLEEQRLATLEARIDADLAAGRDVGAELGGLVAAHPYRERLRGQLMLAQYRAGRQAEALDGFTAFRRRLDEELGLEPGPELRELQERILRQDPALAAARHVAPRPPRRRTAAIALAALLAGSAAFLIAGDDDAGPSRATGGGALVELDPATGAPGERLPVGTTPAAVALGAGAAWVVDADAQTISQVAGDGSIETFAVGATPTGVAVGAGGVWVGAGETAATRQSAGPVTTGLVRVDAGARTVRARVSLPAARAFADVGDRVVAATPDAVWAVAPDGTVVRRQGDAARRVRAPRARAVAADGSDVWVLGEAGEVGRVDPRTLRVDDPVRISTSGLGDVAAGAGAAWVTAPGDGTLWRVDAGTPPTARTIDVGIGASGVAVGAGAVWVTNPLAGTVARVDPRTNRVTRSVRLGGTPRGVAAAADRVVVTVTGDAPAATTAAGGLPRQTCGPLLTGPGGPPDRLIVSDLPLQGGLRLSVQQMTAAIELTLRDHDFRAGRVRLGYQSCDDSVARTGLFDEAKCAANARLYARTAAVIGVVGALNSPCTAAELPVVNRAGLALVSPLSSQISLTRGSAAELARLYPTRRRTFARVFGADDHQAEALASLAGQLGARRLATIDDGDPVYGELLARVFQRSAAGRGLALVASGHWNPAARSQRPMAERLAARRPDAVLVSGLLDNDGAAVVRALRRALGPRPALLLVDGLTPANLLVDGAGEAARGAYLAVNGLLPEAFGPAGRRLAARLRATVPGAGIEPSALYAAAAAEALLDAVARSDGSRPSVADALLGTRIDSVVGPLSFTGAGDPVAAPVSILRLRPGARGDAVFDRVIAG